MSLHHWAKAREQWQVAICEQAICPAASVRVKACVRRYPRMLETFRLLMLRTRQCVSAGRAVREPMPKCPAEPSP